MLNESARPLVIPAYLAMVCGERRKRQPMIVRLFIAFSAAVPCTTCKECVHSADTKNFKHPCLVGIRKDAEQRSQQILDVLRLPKGRRVINLAGGGQTTFSDAGGMG